MKTNMELLINYLDSLDIRYYADWDEFVFDDQNAISERSFLRESTAQDLINEFRDAILGLVKVQDGIRFISDNEIFTLNDLDFDLLKESVSAFCKDTKASTDYFDTIVLQKSAYAPFCDFCDFCNNWGLFDSMFSVSMRTEDDIMNADGDGIVLIWNDHDADFQVLENRFLTEAAFKVCRMN